MADRTGYRPEECGAVQRYRDMGDDTFALVVAADSDAGATIGEGGTGTTGASAARLHSGLPCQSVLLVNTHATLTLKFGNANSQPIPLAAGASVSIPATNVNQIYVINGSGAATYAWLPVVAG